MSVTGRTSIQRDRSSSIASVSSNYSYIKNYSVSEYTDEELQHQIKLCINETSRLNAENDLFEKFLLRMHPSSLTGMSQALDVASAVAQRVQMVASQMNYPVSVSTSASFSRAGTDMMSGSQVHRLTAATTATRPHAVGSSNMKLSTYKISVNFCMDLVAREMEEMKLSLEALSNECKKGKFRLKSQIEEKKITLADIRQTRATLEQAILIDSLDPLTGRIPAEKFLRYMNDVLKSLDQKLGKMRMRTSAMRSQLQRIKAQLEQKIELGETIHPVDFEELKIENKDFAESLEDKNKYLLELKRVTGYCSQNLNAKKRNLDDLMDRMKKVVEAIKDKEKAVQKLLVEEKKANEEVIAAQEENTQIKEIVTNYSAPPVMDYIKCKAELQELRRNLKIWDRRVKLQQITISLLAHKLKSRSGQEQKSHWLRRKNSQSFASGEESYFSEDTSTKVLAPTLKRGSSKRKSKTSTDPKKNALKV